MCLTFNHTPVNPVNPGLIVFADQLSGRDAMALSFVRFRKTDNCIVNFVHSHCLTASSSGSKIELLYPQKTTTGEEGNTGEREGKRSALFSFLFSPRVSPPGGW